MLKGDIWANQVILYTGYARAKQQMTVSATAHI